MSVTSDRMQNSISPVCDDQAAPNNEANIENSENNYSSILARFSHLDSDDHNELTTVSKLPPPQHTSSQFSGLITNEPLLDGFSLLRLVQQFLNPDIYYIGLAYTRESRAKEDAHIQFQQSKNTDLKQVSISPWQGNPEVEPEHQSNGFVPAHQQSAADLLSRIVASKVQSTRPRNILEEVNHLNPLQKCIDSSKVLQSIVRLLTICLSLVAIMISIDKSLSTILLCLFSRSDIKRQSSISGKPSMPYEASDVSMSWIVLVLVNLSSTYIILSTVFNGHLLWNLLSQRLFLVSRRFQYKTMLSLLVFAYLEYIVNISFINNLFGWSFINDDIESNGKTKSNNLHQSYSILSRLEIFVTDQDDNNDFMDILLTILQFSRGVIRISPYITINYVIICLNEHIKTIRNQTLLTDSLKKKQKLHFVVKSSRVANLARASGRTAGEHHPRNGARLFNATNLSANGGLGGERSKKRVIFATDASSGYTNTNNVLNNSYVNNESRPLQLDANASRSQTPSPIGSIFSDSKDMVSKNNVVRRTRGEAKAAKRSPYSDRIRDFYELESYVTNVYIFTGRLNRLMSRQGLATFFIVHNLIISCSLIVPEAIRGGPPMVYFIRVLVIIIGIVPFTCGQSLNGQLEQLSKQIDRIIIQQQFFGRRRDNLVRIRELLHDIRVNCAGMLNFNIETGLKYLVIAFASAFFIEQEDYKLTRRH